MKSIVNFDCYLLKKGNKKIFLEKKEMPRETKLGTLVDIYLIYPKGDMIKLSNCFLILDLNLLKNPEKEGDLYREGVFDVLFDMKRNERILATRSGNFGELYYDKKNNMILKYSYDEYGEATKFYLDEYHLKTKIEAISSKKYKLEYLYKGKRILSSIPEVKFNGGSFFIEYLTTEPNKYRGTKKSYGDMMNITIVVADNIIKYKNVFGDFSRELFFGTSKTAKLYQEEIAKIITNPNIIENLFNNYNGSFGIINYNYVTHNIEKRINDYQIINIRNFRSKYHYNIKVERSKNG